MSVENVGVVGAGTMGVGVAHLFAMNDLSVVLVDVSDSALERAREAIASNIRLYPMVAPEFGRREPSEVLDRIRFTTDLGDLKTADYVVENATEKWEIKAEIYPELDTVCPEHCAFGVDTSAISITRVGALTRRPEQVVGTHFMNPAPLKPLVEVIRGFHTSDETVSRTRSLIGGLGKNSIVVNDSPGFVTNRVMMLTVNEAVFLLQENVADSASDVDRLFKDCFGHRMGPLETADLIGLDTVLYSLDALYEGFNDDKYRPATLLKRMVDAGLHGRKSGRGFYAYE